ncbi:hypothetical protein [Vibrio phage vB_VibM_10AMN]|uniref:Uncharacterized protein n=1 Tax=Staphylococcus phage vB_VibM_10AMN12 TaxID=3076785 RepID=A0AA96QZA0_9CAUD|nr:hypothetical protein [Vibrio phage vB_VibM_10AMN]WNO47378.1 hypothetical protein [Staphylococcus phage vB_VibM_10AMN12]
MSDYYNNKIQEMIGNHSKEELAKKVINYQGREVIRSSSLCEQLTRIFGDVRLCEELLKLDENTNVVPILESISDTLKKEIELQRDYYDGSM